MVVSNANCSDAGRKWVGSSCSLILVESARKRSSKQKCLFDEDHKVGRGIGVGELILDTVNVNVAYNQVVA